MADELANPGVALRTFLRESPVLSNVSYLGSNQKIYIGWPFDRNAPLNVPPFQNIIVINLGRGGRGNIEMGQFETRVDIFCYGVDDAQCKKIWRALDNYLVPTIGPDRRKTSFTRNNCQINHILREGGDFTLPDPDAANWPYTWASYIINYNGEPRT